MDRETKVVLLWIFIGLFLIFLFWYISTQGSA
jgi:hypothetical protein